MKHFPIHLLFENLTPTKPKTANLQLANCPHDETIQRPSIKINIMNREFNNNHHDYDDDDDNEHLGVDNAVHKNDDKDKKKSNNNLNHIMIEPSFMDLFGSRLISQLVGCSAFQSQLLLDDKGMDVNVNNSRKSSRKCVNKMTSRSPLAGIGNGDNNDDRNRLRFYWRTKCIPFPPSSPSITSTKRHGNKYSSITSTSSSIISSSRCHDHGCWNYSPDGLWITISSPM